VPGMLDAQQFPVPDDVGPEMAAGVVNKQQHLAQTQRGHGMQGFQHLPGQRGDTEYNHPGRQFSGPLPVQCLGLFQKIMTEGWRLALRIFTYND
jgi:hypothetical protein